MSLHAFSCGSGVSKVICLAWLPFILENWRIRILIVEEVFVNHTWIAVKSFILLVIWPKRRLFRIVCWLTLWIKYKLIDILRKVVIIPCICLICRKWWLFASFSVRGLEGVAKHLLLISQFTNAIIVPICMGHDWWLGLRILIGLFLAVSYSILSMHVHPDIHQQHIVLALTL